MKSIKTVKTIGEVMEILIDTAKNGTKEQQKKVWNEYITKIKEANNISEEDAAKAAISNIGYMSGYYDSKTATLLHKKYGAVHPIFGTSIIEY